MNKKRPNIYHRLMQVAGTGFMKLFFRLLYHSMSWTYDLVAASVSVGRWNQWVLSAARLVKGQQVLELGYGPGHLQLHLLEAGLTPYGLDESRQMARQAARRLARRGYSPRLCRGLAQRLPYPEASFDSVVATFPTPYIVDPHTLEEVRRVLRPGGRLVVLMVAWITGKSLLDRLMAAVFRLTREVPRDDQKLEEYVEPYRKAGFKASLRFVDLSGSRLMFILAEK